MEAYRPIPLYGAGAEKEQATHKGNECVYVWRPAFFWLFPV